jgi:hypothetical protein
VAKEPGTSFPSETRQLVRQDRLKLDGGGPPMLLVIILAIAIVGAVVYFLARYH